MNLSSSRRVIAVLHLGQTHDEFPEVTAALSRLGIESRLIRLDDCESVDWSSFAAVNIRECRGYHLDPGFPDRLERVHGHIAPLDFTNPMAVVRGTLDKAAYLPLLQQAGIDLVPTHWLPEPTEPDLEALFEAAGCNDIVVKPTISSKSWNTYRITRGRSGVMVRASAQQTPKRFPTLADAARSLRDELKQRACCVQPYLAEIESLGETSFVFLGGRFSHAVRKRPAAGGWLAHESYGGINTRCRPAAREIGWAADIHELLERRYGPLTYARIDTLSNRGRRLLLECELIVPRLFLREGSAAERYAAILASRLAPG